MKEELTTMSKKERNRMTTAVSYREHQLTTGEGAKLPGISERQMYRIMSRRMRQNGIITNERQKRPHRKRRERRPASQGQWYSLTAVIMTGLKEEHLCVVC